MTDPRQFCESCQRWLQHNMIYCPLYPGTHPTAKKWSSCVCLIHTCYEAPKLKDKNKADTYNDF